MTSLSSIGLQIKERIENASIDEKYEMLNNLYNKWVINTEKEKNKTIFDYLSIAIRNFGLTPEGLQMGSFERARLICLSELSYLRLYVDIDELGHLENLKESMIIKFNRIFRSVVDAENALRNALHLENSMVENDIGGAGDQLDITRYTPMDTSNNTPYQNLLLFLLENLIRRGYRRYGGDCYKKIYTDGGYDTHTWSLTMTLKEFIFDVVRKETHYEMWQNMTNAKNNVDASIEFLTHYKGLEFEDIKKDRHVYSFNNGIYITCKKNEELGIYEDEWIPFTGPGSKKISSSIVACNYFNFDFDIEKCNDGFEIIKNKCPSFKSILDYQNFEEEVQRWLCVLLGRNLYEVGELDGWQIIGFLLGQAGTGKSTIINYILKKFFEERDVATLSNNIESKFGLSAIHDKLLFVAPEIKGNFGLEQSEFQSMVSGESISVAEKNKIARQVMWKVPGMMAGNEVPQYSDNSGSISRRLLVFMFDRKVKKGDTHLSIKLIKEIGNILKACNMLYLDAVNKYGSDDIWSIVPKYFINSRDEMAETTNSLTAFLRSDRVILGKDLKCREGEFVDAFNLFSKEMNLPRQRWSYQYSLGPFSNFDIVCDKHSRAKKNSNGLRISGTFLHGVDLVLREQEDLKYNEM
jgi:hypothetical protein